MTKSFIQRCQTKSARFRILERELARLRKHLIPKIFDPLGRYSDEVYTKTRAYKALVHAEIEGYIEDRVRKICNLCVQKWLDTGVISQPLVSLVAYMVANKQVTPARLLNEQKELQQLIEQSSHSYNYCVSTNHGIKESNVVNLLLPVGIEYSGLDSIWLGTMNSYGEERGSVVHTSVHGSVTATIDPKTECDTVDAIMTGLKELDEKLNTLEYGI